MVMGDKRGGGVIHLGCALVLSTILTCPDGDRREFFKPPSSCLTGPSCQLCEDTVTFFDQQVCCYHCRLDNVVINNHLCHCINTRLLDPPHVAALKLQGNCSRGKTCDNCAVKMSTDASLGAEATPGMLHFCCPDCGIVVPFFHRDTHACHCAGDTQGREHQLAPKYDPSKNPPTTTPSPSPPPAPATSTAAATLTSQTWPLSCPVFFLGVSLVVFVLGHFCHCQKFVMKSR